MVALAALALASTSATVALAQDKMSSGGAMMDKKMGMQQGRTMSGKNMRGRRMMRMSAADKRMMDRMMMGMSAADKRTMMRMSRSEKMLMMKMMKQGGNMGRRM
jgi:hypothetical protein